MRSIACRSGSRATVIVWPLAWIMVSGSVMIATWPFQKTRSPRRRPAKSAPGSIARADRRGLHVGIAQHALPAMRIESCTRPEQSMPKPLAPPHR